MRSFSAVEEHAMGSLETGYRTDKGKVRSDNQDCGSSFNTPVGELFVVCDGMGGHQGGAIASALAVKEIGRVANGVLPATPPQVALDKAIEAANDAVYQMASGDASLRGMGTTGVILLLTSDDYCLGHIGDSRIYRVAGGHIEQVTKDHSFVQILVDEGHITSEAAKTHARKNEITHYIGEGPDMEHVIQGPFPLQGDEVFLLCSDGLSDLVDADEIRQLALEGHAQTACNALVDLALERGGYDNVTALMVKACMGAAGEDTRRPASQGPHQSVPPKSRAFFWGIIFIMAGLFAAIVLLAYPYLSGMFSAGSKAIDKLRNATLGHHQVDAQRGADDRKTANSKKADGAQQAADAPKPAADKTAAKSPEHSAAPKPEDVSREQAELADFIIDKVAKGQRNELLGRTYNAKTSKELGQVRGEAKKAADVRKAADELKTAKQAAVNEIGKRSRLSDKEKTAVKKEVEAAQTVKEVQTIQNSIKKNQLK
jgi:PPM family protein phosphatase